MKSNNKNDVAKLVAQLTFAATALIVAIGITLISSQLFPELLKKDW